MTTSSKSSRKSQSPGAQVHRMRDELHVKAHLAGMDAKLLWDELEPRLHELEQGLAKQTEDATNAVSNLASQMVNGLRNLVSRRGHSHGTLVRELMSTRHIVCTVDDSLSRAARLMWENDVGWLPVEDGAGRAIGAITDRDICMAAYMQSKPLPEIGVSAAMSQELFSCSPDDTLETAERILREHQVRRLPVLDSEQRVIGAISLADIVHYVQRRTAQKKANGVQSEFTDTMATICTPRETRDAAE